MRYVFIVCHTAVTYLQHIEVVPSSWLAFVEDRSGFVEDVHDGTMEAWEGAFVGVAGAAGVRAVEGVVDVAAHTPGVGNGLGPIPGGVDAPVAHGVEDWTTGCVEGIGHGFIAVVGYEAGAFLAFVVAIVVFEIICNCCLV